MGAGYTELFFLDEPTALAAGHRPCFECRREDAKRFAECWAIAQGLNRPPRAAEMDKVLHEERLDGRAKGLHVAECKTLPSGAMIVVDKQAYLIEAEIMRSWSPSGYSDAVSCPAGSVQTLTPPTIIGILSAGYAHSTFS